MSLTPEDVVFYRGRNLILTKDTDLVVLEGVTLNITGKVMINGRPLADVVKYKYQFQYGAVDPPTGNQVRLNNDVQTSATEVKIRYISADGVDAKTVLLKTDKGQIVHIQDEDDSSKMQAYDITGPAVDVPVNSYVSIPVTWREGRDPILDQAVIVSIIY